MAAEVKILVEGATNAQAAEGGPEKTRPTITLIKDGDLVIVADPGVLESQEILINALKEEGLHPHDVNIVFISHSHLDHYRNIGMFPKAKTLEFFGLWNKESVEEWPEQFSPHIQILRTPGHDYTGLTLLATTSDGTVAVCGDIFWRENYPADPKDDLYASDFEKLLESRKLVIKMADWIIPGHGLPFRAQKQPAEAETKQTIAGGEDKKQKIIFCRKCKNPIKTTKESCLCRPWLCFKCCECTIDCDSCSCSHRSRTAENSK